MWHIIKPSDISSLYTLRSSTVIWYVINSHVTCHQQPCDISPTVMWHIISSHVTYHQQSCDISSTAMCSIINSHVTYHQQSCDISSLHTWWSSIAMWHILTSYLMIINSHVTAGSIDGRSTVQVRICQLLDGALQQSVRLYNNTLYAMSVGFISDSHTQQRKQSKLLMHYIQVGKFLLL